MQNVYSLTGGPPRMSPHPIHAQSQQIDMNSALKIGTKVVLSATPLGLAAKLAAGKLIDKGIDKTFPPEHQRAAAAQAMGRSAKELAEGRQQTKNRGVFAQPEQEHAQGQARKHGPKPR